MKKPVNNDATTSAKCSDIGVRGVAICEILAHGRIDEVARLAIELELAGYNIGTTDTGAWTCHWSEGA